MPRALTPLLLTLTLLALTAPPPGRVLAGPPEGVSGKTVLSRDRVSEMLLRYRREPDPHRRVAWINEAAEIDDPRVAVALGEALSDPDEGVRMQAAFGIFFHQTGQKPKRMLPPRAVLDTARQWWAEHEDDLRRRARKLSR